MTNCWYSTFTDSCTLINSFRQQLQYSYTIQNIDKCIINYKRTILVAPTAHWLMYYAHLIIQHYILTEKNDIEFGHKNNFQTQMK